MKVLHILNSRSFSGAENVAISIINGLKPEIGCVYMSPCGSIREVLEENHIDYIIVRRLNVWNIRAAIRRIHPDLIHAHDFTASILAACAARELPVINHLHNNPPWIKRKCLKTFAYKYAAKKAIKILTVSDSVMNEYVYGKIFRDKTLVIGNPIDVKKIRGMAAKADLKEKSDIAFFGRIATQKNPFFFIDVIDKIKESIPEVVAIMVGDGELRRKVEDYITALGLKENIKLYGFQKNPFGLIKNTKVVCMPSQWEGFGLTAVEALANGKPVIAAPVGGLVNFITDECGKLIDIRSQEAVAKYSDEIIRILNDRMYALSKEKGAFEQADALDNCKAYIDAIVKIYKECTVKI